MKAQERVALPWVRPRKSFAWLPLSEQLVSLSIGALIVLALLPMLLEPRAARTLGQALRRPPSSRAAITRLEQHYQFTWLHSGTAREQAIRGRVLALQAGVLLVGTIAGRATHAPARRSTQALCYGTASRIRARAALTRSW